MTRSAVEALITLWFLTQRRAADTRGTKFNRWVTPEDADEDLLRSALLAFEP